MRTNLTVGSMGIVQRPIKHQQKNSKRSANLDFFNGCMAAAYTTVIDGKVDSREDAMLRTLLMTIEQFKLYDKRHGNEIYEDFKRDLLKNVDAGKRAIAEIMTLLDVDETAIEAFDIKLQEAQFD